MAVVRKRQDDTNLKILRELVTSGGGNRQCFDCGQKGPTYVNMTIGSFVCTRCSGVLRGLTPPHRVKSISMATFTPDEIEFLKSHGNDFCAKTWLGLWDPKRIIHQDQRELMIDKYERKRYYLEPASPLKSLTNATKVSSLSSSNNSISNNQNNNSSSSSSNISITNNISNNKSSITTSSTDNNFKNIALTPPSSLRITANGIVNSSSSSHSRQNRYNYQSDSNSNSTTNGGLMNGFNGIGGSASISRQSGGNKNSSSGNASENNSHHGFTPDSEFVADFSSANIFNASTTNPSLINGSKIHQNGVNNLQQKNFVNGGTPNRVISGNTTTSATNLNENFADFDHAPIYNSAAAYQPSSCNNNINFATNCNYLPPNSGITDYSQTVQSFSNNFNTIFNNNYNDVIAPNSSTNSSSTSSSSSTTGSNNVNNNSICNSSGLTSSNLNNLQWNVWQQFQWPPFPTCSTTTSVSTTSSEQQSQHIAQNQNRWSLPMSISTSNSMSSSATFNSNSSLNSTPPADRYAALKDLDEQIRESKAAAAAVDTFSNIHAQQPSSANPFKTNPPTQPQPIANPFQTNFSQATTATSTMFGSPTTHHHHHQQQQQQTTNAFGSSTAFNVQQPLPNFNGYTAQAALVTNGTNGCGLGFGAQQIVGSTNLKNPFAASSLNSNNPFL